MNGHAMTVVGVTPESFKGLFSLVDMQAYLPIGVSTLWAQGADKDEYWTKRNGHDLSVLGVLAPGTTRQQAQGSVNVVAERLAQQYPDSHKGVGYRIYPERLARPDPDPTNGMLVVGIVFMALSGLVLLLACSNVANIVLVRATAREREMAIRTALGAARTRIVRQLMTESILLAFLGAAAGLLAGVWASRLISSIHLEIATIPIRFDFSFDWRVFGFGLMAALTTGIVVGLAPAWRAARGDLIRYCMKAAAAFWVRAARACAALWSLRRWRVRSCCWWWPDYLCVARRTWNMLISVLIHRTFSMSRWRLGPSGSMLRAQSSSFVT